jgi:hypothetical protein
MVPYLHLFSAVVHKIHLFGTIWENYAETSTSRGAILHEFGEKNQHLSIKSAICNAQLANKGQI